MAWFSQHCVIVRPRCWVDAIDCPCSLSLPTAHARAHTHAACRLRQGGRLIQGGGQMWRLWGGQLPLSHREAHAHQDAQKERWLSTKQTCKRFLRSIFTDQSCSSFYNPLSEVVIPCWTVPCLFCLFVFLGMFKMFDIPMGARHIVIEENETSPHIIGELFSQSFFPTTEHESSFFKQAFSLWIRL